MSEHKHAPHIELEQDTPRLVVEFRRGDEGTGEQFKWGMVGKLPLMTLVGYITRVQAELAFRAPEPCGNSALVIVRDEEKKAFYYMVDPTIPVDSLVGMLEAVKLTLVQSMMQPNQHPNKQRLFGPDGSIYNGR